MTFRNPYHFVPIANDIPGSIDSPPGTSISREILGHRSFDRFSNDNDVLSGRIVCHLSTRGPVVIGASQTPDPDGYTRVHPFERKGQPAIPSTTLKGLISAVAEAASNSALRVLKENTKYSRRVTMEEVGNAIEDFSAIGMVVEINGELRLRPLAMPALKKQGGHYRLPEKYKRMFPDVRLKAYCYNSGTISSTESGSDFNNLWVA